MPDIQSPRGTRDILPADQPLWQEVRSTAEYVAEQMGFRAITVPTYESVALFQRSIGEGTDVMDKELFLVRSQHTEPGKEEYALRPEGTAGIARAYIEHGMSALPQPVKLYSIVNNFRYDRPQKGRYREHVQLSVEYLGDASAFADAWTIYCAYRFFLDLGLKGVYLNVNTLGTPEEREAYVEVLRASLEPIKDELSEDSRYRLDKNPLRILDSKDQRDHAALAKVPALIESLGEESRARYAQVRAYLDAWQIPYVHNDRLVRGLDYYSHTAFEWMLKGTEGQQSSLGGGGRYDGLISQLGGPATPAVGFGIGLDRVVEALAAQGEDLPKAMGSDVFVVAADDLGRGRATEVIAFLLDDGWAVEAALGRDGVSAQLKAANRSGAAAALILGEEELAKGTVLVKVLADGSQHVVNIVSLSDKLEELLGHPHDCDCDRCA